MLDRQTAFIGKSRLRFDRVIVQFLMDAKLAIPIPEKYSFQKGAAIGVGTEVSSWIPIA